MVFVTVRSSRAQALVWTINIGLAGLLLAVPHRYNTIGFLNQLPFFWSRVVDKLAPLAIVLAVLLLDVAVLWAPARIGGGRLADEIRPHLETRGGLFKLAARGLFGSFVVIALLGLGTICVLSRLQ
jgi:hypothetical protein